MSVLSNAYMPTTRQRFQPSFPLQSFRLSPLFATSCTLAHFPAQAVLFLLLSLATMFDLAKTTLLNRRSFHRLPALPCLCALGFRIARPRFQGLLAPDPSTLLWFVYFLPETSLTIFLLLSLAMSTQSLSGRPFWLLSFFFTPHPHAYSGVCPDCANSICSSSPTSFNSVTLHPLSLALRYHKSLLPLLPLFFPINSVVGCSVNPWLVSPRPPFHQPRSLHHRPPSRPLSISLRRGSAFLLGSYPHTILYDLFVPYLLVPPAALPPCPALYPRVKLRRFLNSQSTCLLSPSAPLLAICWSPGSLRSSASFLSVSHFSGGHCPLKSRLLFLCLAHQPSCSPQFALQSCRLFPPRLSLPRTCLTRCPK